MATFGGSVMDACLIFFVMVFVLVLFCFFCENG